MQHKKITITCTSRCVRSTTHEFSLCTTGGGVPATNAFSLISSEFCLLMLKNRQNMKFILIKVGRWFVKGGDNVQEDPSDLQGLMGRY